MSQAGYKPIYNSSWAVLIGINEYQDPQINDLRGPVSDAEALGQVLVSTYAFPADQVVALTDHQASRASILDSLESLTSDRVDQDDRVLIFFSGHGQVRQGRRKTYHVVPADAELSDWNTFISQGEFLVKCRHIPAKHVLIVLDACHSGSFVREPKHVAPDLEEMLTHGAWQAMGAGLPDQLAFDAGGGRHSLFTEYLLRGLKGEAARLDGVLTATHLFVFVRDGVTQANRNQVPIFGFLPDSDTGEFIFHSGTTAEMPQGIRQALSSDLTRMRVAGVWELESLAMSDDSDTSYGSRAKLQEIATDNTQDDAVRLAAKVATQLSIPMLEALRNGWLDALLFSQTDSSIYDRIVAAIEYDGHNNYYMNNDAIRVFREFGFDKFDDVSRGEKARFAGALVRSALRGAYGPQRLLQDSSHIPDSWLSVIVDETAYYLMEHQHIFVGQLRTRAAFTPLREWVERNAELPGSWVHLVETGRHRTMPQWRTDGTAKLVILEIWQAVNESVDRRRLEISGTNPDLVSEFVELLESSA